MGSTGGCALSFNYHHVTGATTLGRRADLASPGPTAHREPSLAIRDTTALRSLVWMKILNNDFNFAFGWLPSSLNTREKLVTALKFQRLVFPNTGRRNSSGREVPLTTPPHPTSHISARQTVSSQSQWRQLPSREKTSSTATYRP